MTRAIDLTGKRFGDWTVVGVVPDVRLGGGLVWNCECVCGSVKPIRSGALVSGNSRKHALARKIFDQYVPCAALEGVA